MLKSMTGSGRAQGNFDWGSVTLDISSVNHKYQDISLRLPKELSRAEKALQDRLRSAFRRGKVIFRCEVCWSSSYKTCSINREILKEYVENIRETLRELGLEDGLHIEHLLDLPGVIEPALVVDSASEEKMEEDIKTLMESLLEDWLFMREAEGRHLALEIEKHLLEFGKHLESIKNRWPIARSEAIEAFKERIEILLDGQQVALEESRIAQEVAILSDKWDITEEIARLLSHVAKFREIMDNVEVSGKKLDFLLQEMNREVNTIASKVNDSVIRWEAVEAKSELESMREQIQNVE